MPACPSRARAGRHSGLSQLRCRDTDSSLAFLKAPDPPAQPRSVSEAGAQGERGGTALRGQMCQMCVCGAVQHICAPEQRQRALILCWEGLALTRSSWECQHPSAGSWELRGRCSPQFQHQTGAVRPNWSSGDTGDTCQENGRRGD